MVKFMFIASLVTGLLLALVPNLLWIIGKIIGIFAKYRLPYAPFGYTALGLALLLWGIVAYGYNIGRWRLDVNHIEYSHPDIPSEFRGFKIVHISDLHLSTFDGHPEKLQRIINTINAQHADLICFTGDMVTIGTQEAEPYTDMLQTLQSEYGCNR